MYNCLKNKKYLIAFFIFLIAKSSFCQSTRIKDISSDSSRLIKEKPVLKRGNLGLELTAAILPPAKITKEQGKYQLKSYLQSSYDLGLNYFHDLNKNLCFIAGIHIIVGKRNFFANIPNEDLNNWDGRKLIEDKELWVAFRMPFLLEKKVSIKKTSYNSIKGGFALRYSGMMIDESIGTTLVYPNNQLVRIFNAELSGSNNGKPWVTFLAGVSKSIVLNNQNIFSASLLADISPTYFLKGNYEITIPNQPIATGTYKINGTSLGLSIQYVFTGSNKRIVKEYQKRAF